jgi:Leucine-rich repeat (LRR) protein
LKPILIFKKLFFSIHRCISSQFTSTTPDTRITSITGNFDYPFLSGVESLTFTKATVTFIPDLTLFARQFPKFKQLWIIGSGLKHVERRQLAKIPQLTFINFLNNDIESLPEDAFNDLVNLDTLIVRDNKIKLLPPKLLWNLPKLKIFASNGNQIELIPRDFFKNHRELEQIWINDNKIRRIEVDFTLLPKLTILDLSSNSCINEVCQSCNIDRLRQIQQKINRNCN